MSDHANAAAYRKMYDAMNAGDMAAAADSLADDVVWWEIGAPEPVRGKAALMERMEGWADYGITAELHDAVANDDHLIVLLDVTANKDGETFNYRTAEIMHVNDDGQVTERWAFSDDTQAIIEFFS